MDIRKIKKLIELIEDSDVAEIEIKEGEAAQPEEYMEIFRGLRGKPDAEIRPEGRF